MDPMAYDGETASPDAFSDDSSECPSGGGSNQLDNRLQVIIWLKEHYRVGDAGSMRKSFVYQHYLDACRESGMEGAPISHTFFGKLVRRAFPGIKCNRKGPRGDAHQCYTHLERLPTAQRLGAWQVEQITEELSKCSSSGSPTGSRLSPLRPKTSPRPRDTYHHQHHQNQEHDDEVPSTPISDDLAHHQQQQPRRHPHHNQHAHQGGQCFSSCCSPLSSPPIAFSTSASTSSSFSSSPRSSCCPEGLEEGEFAPEEAPSCCGGHHHGHPHYHPSSSSSSSSCDESYESYHPDEQLSLLPQQQQPYLPDLAYAAPAFLSYPAFYGHPATYSSSYPPAAADHHAQQQHHQQLPLHHQQHQQHQQYPQSASPTFCLSSTGGGEEEGEEEFGVGNVTALASPRLGNGMALTFADYLTACQTARLQQHPLHTSATIGEGEFETDRGEDAATAWSADGCSRAEPLAALSWASTAWSDAIY